ncbi:MAG: VWA domain-containing protein [Chloroflexi bacterium]|nr:VWA domain-containing protein [Chloroflexota bacterium]
MPSDGQTRWPGRSCIASCDSGRRCERRGYQQIRPGYRPLQRPLGSLTLGGGMTCTLRRGRHSSPDLTNEIPLTGYSGAAAFVFELDEPPDASQSDDGSAPPAVASYSSSETLRTRDFSHLTDAEIAVLRRLMARLRTRSAQRLTRRMRPSPRGATLDLRRTIRRSLTTGGEPLTFARRELKVRPRPIVLLCDVSGSMERYTRLLLQFLHTVSHGTGATVETFAYATRLTRITPALKRRRVEDALTRVHEDVQDLHGGTRTGEALGSFNRNWARRVLGRGAIVLIISDGWDRGDPVQLGREMARLQRTSFRLFWLNPLLGSPSYKPLTRGMQAALPYLDDFLPSHSLESLHDLVALLAELPLRRSGPVPAHARRRPRSPFLPAMVRPR